MEPKQRTFSVWYAIVAMLALFGVRTFLLMPHPENMSYSEFKALAYGGRVGARNNPGGGATFSFTLPASEAGY